MVRKNIQTFSFVQIVGQMAGMDMEIDNMKIINKVDVSSWKFEHKCPGCDSTLEVEAKDLLCSHYDGDFREGAYDTFYTHCVVCAYMLTVPSDYIPKLLQAMVKKEAMVKKG